MYNFKTSWRIKVVFFLSICKGNDKYTRLQKIFNPIIYVKPLLEEGICFSTALFWFNLEFIQSQVSTLKNDGRCTMPCETYTAHKVQGKLYFGNICSCAKDIVAF